MMKRWIFAPEKVARDIATLKLRQRRDLDLALCANSVLKRHQWKKYASAINFTAPYEITACGRFNPPGGEIAVWYASDSALTSMAESYGRVLQLQGTIAYPEVALQSHYICSVDVLRPVKTINVVRLCELLHIPLNALESEDYAFTQWLMHHLFAEYGEEYDGIAYDSRHLRYKKCFAFWRKLTGDIPFKDTAGGMVPLLDYKEYNVELFPPGWMDLYMSGDDMLEILLNFRITPEPY